MAGLTVHIGSSDKGRIERAARRLRFFEERVHIVTEPGFSAAWVGHDDPLLYGPARDPRTGVWLMTSGRTAWDEPEWRRAEALESYEGGLANRLLLERYLGAGDLCSPNGPCAVVAWDPRSRTVHLWTDQFGYHPVFLYDGESAARAVIGTFPDSLADDPSVTTTLDEVSIAEFLSAWRVTPPHTYYREIQYAGAATHHVWDLGRGTHRSSVYWEPDPSRQFPTCEAAAEELAHALTQAIRIRTLKRLAPVLSYTSGGMDSRVVLFGVTNPGDLVGFNLYDQPNNEAAVARRLCEAAGVRYHGFRRDQDYYPAWIAEGVRLSGAMWSVEDNHFLGTRKSVLELGANTVLSACTADWLFKGYGLEKSYRRLFGRNLPLKRFESRRVDGFLPNVPRPVPEEFARDVGSRMDAWFEGTPRLLVGDEDWLKVEDRRVRPACYAVSVSGQIMYRVFPYDTFLADGRVADCYGRMRAEWKLNSDVWGKAVSRICVAGKGIQDANFGWRVGASSSRKVASFARGWIQRRLRPEPLDPDGLATRGSWPNLSWYVRNSTTLRDLWESVSPAVRQVVRRAWGTDPWAQPLQLWNGSANDLFRIVTVARFLDRSRSE